MTALFAKGKRNWTGIMGLATLLVLTAAAGAFAQNGKRKSPGSDICVAKDLANYEDAMYTSIQEAVNAAKAGQVIEILDTEIYKEQVTIDGRTTSPWDGQNGGSVKKVVGGKNGITIRFVVPANASWNHARPTIQWQDLTNTHPRNSTEAKSDNELTGAGNYETAGALRVLRASNVTIEGIAVDGEGGEAFGFPGVWCDKNGQNCEPLDHGNAAITLAVATKVTIRDCDIKNAFFGIYIKDRNTGGAFANPNPSDINPPTPLSGFDEVGLHLFEYNKVHANVVGFFFESAWNMGSTARYNLIYNNKQKNGAGKWTKEDQKNGGAFLFKDMYLCPVAIYNNTFYDNSGNFLGHWQSGGQHLIFNNIFSKSTPSENPGNSHMSLDGKFPYRMHNSVFSADANDQNGVRIQGQGNFDCGTGVNTNEPYAINGAYIANVQVNGYAAITGSSQTLKICTGGNWNGTQTQAQTMIMPGASITALAGTTPAITFGAAAGIRWLQTEGLTRQVSIDNVMKPYTMPSLFKSLLETSDDFLVPDWNNQFVKDYIQNKGWDVAGIRNNDGKIADLGAIPSTGSRQRTVARITPTSVTTIAANGNATANFKLGLDNGTMTNTRIKLLRWVAPIPVNAKKENNPDGNGFDWPGSIEVVAQDAIKTIPDTRTVYIGNNSLTNIATGSTTAPKYGFFEIIIEGTDANGNAVSSDVGFLPYRELKYFFTIKLYDDVTGKEVDTAVGVDAGKTYTMGVTKNCDPNGDCPNTVDEVSYSLLSGPTAFIRQYPPKDTLLTSDKNVSMPGKPVGTEVKYSVYFTAAGAETIFASGVATEVQNPTLPKNTRLVFVGTKDIKVNPGDPDHLVFKDPIPLAQVGTGLAPVINRGVEQAVLVEVRDKWDNVVDNKATAVTIEVTANPTIGEIVGPKTVNSVKGVATFVAKATDGAAVGNTFDMTATLAGKTQTDQYNVGRLRVGRSLDRLQVFYSDTGSTKTWKDYYNPEVTIDGKVGDWFKITVKVVVGDTVKTSHPKQYVLVENDDSRLVFSATQGGASGNVFDLVGGVAEFWVSTADGVNEDISSYVTVRALTTSNPNDINGGVTSGNREDINFSKKSTTIEYAVVYGDGQGRPDSVLVYYKTGSASLLEPGALTSSVTLTWGGVDLVSTTVAARGANLLHASFAGVANRPTGYTSITGLGVNLITLAGVGTAAPVTGFDVYDGVGPVLGNGEAGDGAGGVPRVYSNEAGNAEDTLEIHVSEALRSEGGSIKLPKLFYSAGPAEPAVGATGTQLEVLAISGDGRPYKLVVRGVPQPAVGGWIRFDPSGDATDEAASQSIGTLPDNKPHDENRWVQLRLKELDPEIQYAYYKCDNTTGKPSYAVLKLNKPNIDLAKLSDWFVGGSVKFDNTKGAVAVDATNITTIFPEFGGDTLRIDLKEASSFASASAAIRTSAAMGFTLKYSNNTGWLDKEGSAVDSAAPVLATSKAVLKTGAIMPNESEFYKDTLVVYFSEELNAASQAAALENPLRLKAKGGASDRYGDNSIPRLQLIGTVGYDRDAGFFKASYLLLDAVHDDYQPGDSVQIYEGARVGDALGNEQLASNNRWVMLDVSSTPTWTVKIRNNPFVSGGTSKGVGVKVSPNAKGGTKVRITADIKVFDNLGTLVRDTTVSDSVNRNVEWLWDGTNSKGRMVGTGAYLLKAQCKSYVDDKKPEVFNIDKKTLGIVRK